jgi:hypothetical protein
MFRRHGVCDVDEHGASTRHENACIAMLKQGKRPQADSHVHGIKRCKWFYHDMNQENTDTFPQIPYML